MFAADGQGSLTTIERIIVPYTVFEYVAAVTTTACPEFCPLR